MYFTTFARAIMETGAAGLRCGMAATSPHGMLFDSTGDGAGLWVSNNTFEDGDLRSPTSASIAASVVGVTPQTPYSNTDLVNINATAARQSAINYRVISGMLRVRCITPNMFRGGLVYMLTSPNNGPLDNGGGVSPAQLLSFKDAAIELNGGQWATIVWTPKVPDDFIFRSAFPPAGQAAKYMVCLAQNPGGVTTLSYLQFEVEVRFHYELIGPGAQFGTVPRMSDPIGGPAAIEVAQNLAERAAHHGRKIVETASSIKSGYERVANAWNTAEKIVSSFSGPATGAILAALG